MVLVDSDGELAYVWLPNAIKPKGNVSLSTSVANLLIIYLT